MKIIADTNVLIRVFVNDDPVQSQIARKFLLEADTVIIGWHALCELAWVLRYSYKFSKEQIAGLIRDLKDRENVVTDRTAMDAGLAAIDAGADFADGVIAYEGRWMGGDMFVSFDKKAVTAIEKQGYEAKLAGA